MSHHIMQYIYMSLSLSIYIYIYSIIIIIIIIIGFSSFEAVARLGNYMVAQGTVAPAPFNGASNKI